jgi:hypothetical protein
MPRTGVSTSRYQRGGNRPRQTIGLRAQERARFPSRRSSPWMRTAPQVRFSVARRTINAVSSSLIGGRRAVAVGAISRRPVGDASATMSWVRRCGRNAGISAEAGTALRVLHGRPSPVAGEGWCGAALRPHGAGRRIMASLVHTYELLQLSSTDLNCIKPQVNHRERHRRESLPGVSSWYFRAQTQTTLVRSLTNIHLWLRIEADLSTRGAGPATRSATVPGTTRPGYGWHSDSAGRGAVTPQFRRLPACIGRADVGYVAAGECGDGRDGRPDRGIRVEVGAAHDTASRTTR